MYEHNHSSASTIPSTSDNRNNASSSGSSEGRQLQQPQSQSAPSNPTITPIEKGNSTVANAGSRRSITEGVCCVTSSPSTSKQQSPPAVSVDCISITGSESRLSRYSARLESGEGPTGDSHHQPTHYGSSSTTFSTGSSNLTGSSFGTAGLSLDQTSEASSSGVATMSSTDHLPITMALSRSSVDDSTPTMSTLTGGGTAAELRRELEPILYDAASTMIPGGGAFDIPAISSLSLNSAPTNGSSATKARVSSDTATTDSSTNPSLLLTSQNQAQSTPSLLWTYTANSINCPNVSSSHKRQTARHGSKISSMISGVAKSKVKTALGPTEQQQKEMKTAKVANCGDKKREGSGSSREKSSAKTSSSTIGDESTQQLPANMETPSATLVANQQLDQNIVIPAPPHSSSPTASHHSLLGSSPLPSVFNCAATSCSQIICTPLRTIVSQNRRRYQMDGFNLDLTYITDRIIAMGYPADTKEALYRNSMSHIVKFLEHYHPGHYKVFNLRGQYVYDPANFHNRVVSFEMTDHHPPRLELMAPFCREVHDYLEADPLNVVAVHCKAGKGRTGVMICAYLCYIAFYRTPRQNMDYYSIIRTHNNKGVTIPSQRRYVYYFAHLRERQLNYMPLRCELVGIYLERPPKLCGPFSKGALKVRVASGDVDVFLGDDMWLNGEQYEEEEELHRRYPLMAGGDDQYDPMQPAKTNDNCGRNCISRRCYGWTVPENKRVFLEGDIRVDIFQKSRLKLFNVKQERKKIGHIWFNTMFTCPGFCGGQYVHGDEAYPYPESMIVRRRFKRKQQAKDMISQREEEQSTAREDIGDANTQILNSGNSNFSSTPALSAHHPASAPSIAATENSSADEGTGGKDQLQPREKSGSLRFGGIKLANGMTSISGNGKKRSARSPCRQLIESDQKSWHSQDGELRQHRVAPGIVSSAEKQPMPPRKQCRSSLDTAESEYEEEIVVEKPPGLDKHCSAELLRGIYPNEKLAPRFGIEEIIRDAFQKNLINDIYNARRMSQPRDGPLIPKASIDRPKAGGPNCLMRKSDEHVGTFGVQEIDRAYKNKDIDLGFKVFVLTRCIDESNPCDLRLADQFIRVTHQKQTQKEREKLEKMQQKHRKLMQQAHKQTNAQIHGVNDNKKGTDPEIGGPMLEFGIVDVEQLQTAEEAGECSTPISPQQKHFVGDPRLCDPHLSKFFFRQRVTSKSRHPSVHHHCSLRTPDPQVCSKYRCTGAGTVIQTRRTLTATTNVPSHCVTSAITAEDDEDLEPLQADEEDATSFDDFDFFHPRHQTGSTVRDVKTSTNTPINRNATGQPSRGTTSPDEAPMIDQHLEGEINPLDIDTKQMDKQPDCQRATTSSSRKRNQAGKESVSSAPNSLTSELTAEPEVYHPSDCSLAPSTSSSCSSD